MENVREYISKQGEKIVSWTSHKHPDNPNFMQVVKYIHIQKLDGTHNLRWHLFNSSPNDNHIIRNISLEEAKEKFGDKEDTLITEEMFQKWLEEKKNRK